MLIRTTFMTVDLPMCEKMILEGGRLSFRHKHNEKREVLSVDSREVTAIDSESSNRYDLLLLLFNELKKRKNDSYQVSSITKKIKAELRNFNAVTGSWK